MNILTKNHAGIPRITSIITPIPLNPTLIPRVPMIPLIPFPDSLFRLLQISLHAF